METKTEDTKNELLKKAQTKPVRELVQYDCWLNVGDGDSVIKPNSKGDSLWMSVNDELRNSPGDVLRVQFGPEQNPVDVLRGLQEIMDSIKRDTALDIWHGVCSGCNSCSRVVDKVTGKCAECRFGNGKIDGRKSKDLI